MCAPLSKAASARSFRCSGCREMHGTSKTDLEALWWRSKAIRKKALGGKFVREELKHLPPELRHRPLSPEEFRSLPPQLRWPEKLHGFFSWRPKQLRGPDLMRYLILLAGLDKRFGDCINAFFEHGIVKPDTHKFTPGWQGREIDRANEYQQARCLEEVRAQIKLGMDVRPACRKVAAEWGLGASLDAGEQQLIIRDRLRPKKPKKSKQQKE